jgi:hypothetical protein
MHISLTTKHSRSPMVPRIEVSSEREDLPEKVCTNLPRGTKICFECYSNHSDGEISTARV